jgi:excisionase family DNA binding protein
MQEEILTELRRINESLLNQKSILDIDELARYINISKQTIYKLTAEHSIPHAKLGRKLFFDKKAIDAWILRQQYGNHSY